MKTHREQTRQLNIGSVTLGGGAPVRVQSMTNTDTRDVVATVAQIRRLELAGCEIVRCAVPDMEAATALGEIKKQSRIPVVADIHFDYKLALEAIRRGVDKLRLNPGNIKDPNRVREVAAAAAERGVPIRIGVNAGSIDRSKYPEPTSEALVASALDHIRILEDLDYREIAVSLKAFDVPMTIEAYRLMAEARDYPLHIGITEAGLPAAGSIRSAVGLGIMLWMGIGDTLRVSLTGDPVREVEVSYEILKALGLRERGATLVSCPTCGRCEIDLIALAEEVERRLAKLPPERTVKVAVMGCSVNGPGEARDADFGIAGGKGVGMIFKHGEILRKVPEAELVDALIAEIVGE